MVSYHFISESADLEKVQDVSFVRSDVRSDANIWHGITAFAPPISLADSSSLFYLFSVG